MRKILRTQAVRLFLFGLLSSFLLFAAAFGQSHRSFGERILVTKQSLSKEQQKISSAVRDVVQQLRKSPLRMKSLTAATAATPVVKVDDTWNVHVYIQMANSSPEKIAALRKMQARIEIVNHRWNIVQAWLPFEKIDEVAALDFVRSIRPPGYAVPNSGSVTSEGDVILRAEEVRTLLGIDGSGVRVGVISDGVDSRAVAVSSGDLPENIEVHPAQPGQGDEGTAMLEIIYDLAPGAQLAFSGPRTSLEMIESIKFLADSAFAGIGANIISDDLVFFDQPYFQDGPIAEAVKSAVANGVTYFTSAGNRAQTHYEASYIDDTPGDDPGGVNLHDFGAASGGPSDSFMAVRIAPGGSVVAYLQWNDPFGGSTNDFDLYILDANADSVLVKSEDTQNGSQDPVEVVSWENNTAAEVVVNVAINRYQGATDRLLEMLFYGSSFSLQEYVVTAGSINPGQASTSSAIAVGAIDVSDPGNDDAEPFSSRGPVRHFFPNPITRLKPDIAATDGNLITGAGGFGVPDDGDMRFFGTSAASPHAAAVAALIKSANPNLMPAQIAEALKTTAVDLGPDGADNTFGAGRIDAYAAVQSVMQGGSAVAPPRNLTAVVSGDSVILTWDPPGQSGTNGSAARFGITNRTWLDGLDRSRWTNYSSLGVRVPLAGATEIEEVEPNNRLDQAQRLGGASPLVVRGTAEVTDTGELVIQFQDGTSDDLEDLFLVTTTAPGLKLSLEDFTADCDLWLLDENATNIVAASANEGTTPPEVIDDANLPAGTYVIGVTIFDPAPVGGQSSPYVLRLTGQFAGGTGPTNLQAYNIYRSTSANARETGALIGRTGADTTTFTDIVASAIAADAASMSVLGIQQTLFYQVTAVYDQGESDPSNEVSVQVGGPAGELKPVVAANNQAAGAEFWVDIEVSGVDSLFGVSFELHYSQTAYLDVMMPVTASVLPGPFLGNDVIFVANVDDAAGTVSIGISRKSGQPGVSGDGVISRVRFISLDSTPPQTQVEFSLANISANDPAGNAIQLSPGSTTVTLGGLVVWPGDTNNDSVVNQADVLPLGLYWARTGPPRDKASVAWVGQPATPWTPVASTYADANGDGVVDQTDVLPIGLNWNKTHSGPTLSLGEQFQHRLLGQNGAAALSFLINGDTNPNQEFWVEIQVEEVTNLFGLSFELVYDPKTYLIPQSAEAGSWFGDDVIFFSNIDTSLGKVSVGITRKAGQGGIDGTGVVSRIRMVMSSEAEVGQETNLRLENVTANDPAGQPVSLEVVNGSIITRVVSIEGNQMPEEFALYANVPNPFNPSTRITYDLPLATQVSLQVFDILGRHLRTLVNGRQQPGRYAVIWDGRDERGQAVPTGVYIYRLQAGSYTRARRMLLLK
jgi:hypothetical protein